MATPDTALGAWQRDVLEQLRTRNAQQGRALEPLVTQRTPLALAHALDLVLALVLIPSVS